MKRIKPILFMLFVLVYSANLFSQSEKKALNKAQQHLDFDEFKQAIPYLVEAEKYNPRNSVTQFQLGKCLYIVHEKSRALKHFEAAYDLNKTVDKELNWYYAKCLHYSLEFDKAIEQYNLAKAKLNPKDPRYQEIELEIVHCNYAKEAVKNNNGAKIVNLGPTINTQYAEHSPVINADESILVFTTVYPTNEGCKDDPMCDLEDIYISEKVNGNWTKPKPVKQVNTNDHDATIGLSPDGQRLFIYKDPPGSGDIFESDLKGKEWQKPTSLGKPVNSPKHYEETVSMTSDGKTIFFTSTREGGFGMTDIYTSTLDEKGRWTEPRNLGPKINSKLEERSPFIHPNGVELYFSANGRKDALGGYDIYRCFLQEDGSWSDPENVGYPINTTDDDIYFVLSADHKTGYYASAKEGGYGEKDIYKIIMPEEEKVIVEEEDTLVSKPVTIVNALTILKGVITDAKTGLPIEASIKVIDNEKDVVVSTFNSNSATGRYLVSLPSGKNYGISVEHEGYLFKSVNVNIPKAEGYQEIVKDVALDKIEIGVGIVLNNIFYDVDKSTLRPESKAELDRLYQLLTQNPLLKVEIGGHTDSDGSDDYNEKLSQARSQSVVDYLIKLGISKERLVAKGYGEKSPVAPNDTPENKQLNRRTELKILENQ